MSDAQKRPAFVGSIAKRPDGSIGGSIKEALTGWPIDLELTPSPCGGYDIKGYLGTAAAKEPAS